MSAFRAVAGVMVCLSSFALAQLPDSSAAERVLGPRWKQVSRAAGMIFVGSVLEVEAQPAGQDHPIPTIQTKFRVERAIVGTHLGQVLTIREWAAVGPLQRSVRSGQRTLYFFYPRSRLGLTSQVDRASSPIVIDRSGNVAVLPLPGNARTTAARPPQRAIAPQSISMAQLERAIRSAREGKE